MSPSSAGSWERAHDVIDLDRYMRGARARADHSELCEQLVVDSGGVGVGAGGGARYKQFSVDSGVSDGSYDTRAFRRTRRASNTDGRARAPRDQNSARSFSGLERSDSMRAFRTVCEQALLEQQKQIARVAQLCERLAERGHERLPTDAERNHERLPKDPICVESGSSERSKKSERVYERAQAERSVETQERLPERLPDRLNPERQYERPIESFVERSRRPVRSSDTSDISSSSRSSRELWRKEGHRTQECKTYKIIMSKLDELSRRFSPRPARQPSSSSVSVCDKLVATDPDTRAVRPPVQMQYQASRAARVLARACDLDIAPRHNVATESVIKCESGLSEHFDLDDPLHLYSQAKRLQTMNASTRHPRSQSTEPRGQGEGGNGGDNEGGSESKRRPRSPSLCSVCRGYLRALRQCILAAFTQEAGL